MVSFKPIYKINPYITLTCIGIAYSINLIYYGVLISLLTYMPKIYSIPIFAAVSLFKKILTKSIEYD